MADRANADGPKYEVYVKPAELTFVGPFDKPVKTEFTVNTVAFKKSICRVS